MPSTQEVLMTPVNATLGAVGFAGALTVIPLVAWPLRYYSAKKVGDMTPEVKMFARVCSRMYDLSDDIRGHPVTVGPWKLEKRVTNKVAIFSSASKVLLAFEGTQLRGESWLKDLLRDLQVMLNLEDIASDETLKKCFDALAEFPDADNIYVTGHSLGGVWAYLVAKYAAKFGEARPIRGEVFNPGAAPDLCKVIQKMALGQRLQSIRAHHIAGDGLSCCWAHTPLEHYRPVHILYPHSMSNFLSD
mmetsp:Transcript_52134/g.113709  ORF Transcript_52134/g.113709 Transcript_52134/m.113709 type:complete len:246 (+) Transcript_52134:56-793(+)